jgi:hypothetical protein
MKRFNYTVGLLLGISVVIGAWFHYGPVIEFWVWLVAVFSFLFHMATEARLDQLEAQIELIKANIP